MDEKIEFIDEPLLNPDGSVNENCIAKLNWEILNCPQDYERFSGDKEWTEKRWIFAHNITGYFAMWAVRQSPYSCPDNLETVVKYLKACLDIYFKKQTTYVGGKLKPYSGGMAQISLCEINKLLHDILENMKEVVAWNTPKSGREIKIQFSSRCSDEPPPDESFIDLEALFRNVCISICDERRKNDEFDRKFEEEQKTGKLTV